jgi:hypothetical protein
MNLMMRICDAPSMPHSLFFDSMYLLPDLFLQFLAEEFEFPRSDTADTIHFAGPLMPRRSVEFDEPAWWSELDGSRPVVLVTQGKMARIRISMKRWRLQPRTVGRSIREAFQALSNQSSHDCYLAASSISRISAFDKEMADALRFSSR